MRILKKRRITATQYLKRCQHDSVSLTAVPLRELLSRRHYQSHLKRWDWEPYGIAIRRSVAGELFGAAAVQYLSTAEYRKLPAERRFLFQPTGTRDGSQDWTTEREWRCPVDVRLSRLSLVDGFVFVPTISEAMLVQRVSSLPVLVVAEIR